MFSTAWVTNKIDEKAIDYLESFGFYLCDKQREDDRFAGRNAVTTAQLRNIFAEVKRIEIKLDGSPETWSDLETSILLLRPKIAYNTARVLSKSQMSRMKDLRVLLEKALTNVKNETHFKNFSDILEGIIAYHKVYGGKD
jgi:CRISPR-associated protein Csm2